MKTIILTVLLITATGTACAEIDKTQAVNAIIGEAEGESYYGKYYLACAIRNKGTLKGVYGGNSKRVINRMYSEKVYYDCVRAWKESNKNRTITATHWGGNACDKEWIERAKSSGEFCNFVVVGNQTFFEKKRREAI